MNIFPSPPLPRLPRRARDSHKGDFGRALLIGGSRGMSGAISLSGMAALRGGAGLVTLAVPDVCLDTVAGFEPSYMTAPLKADGAGRLAAEALDEIKHLVIRADVIVCGPGLGRSESLTELVAWLYLNVPQPAVFDADALFALAARPDVLAKPGGPRVLTPHMGEFARLCGLKLPDGTARDDSSIVIQHAREWQCVLVLKRHRTLVSDGGQLYENRTGNPGMATGGSGDVLTGVITALMCQGLAPFAAAQLGVYVHGRAGDLVAAKLGEAGMIARDLIEHLPAAMSEVCD
ncbi:MAG: NAD(P)H-hydrate dehydratase [Planctomycetia bacterium]|nr:NAD(P)H-hydrate dehydratase [Planctomycetia bacterium]